MERYIPCLWVGKFNIKMCFSQSDIFWSISQRFSCRKRQNDCKMYIKWRIPRIAKTTNSEKAQNWRTHTIRFYDFKSYSHLDCEISG